MKLSKRQKTCCAILAPALGVLIVDRAFLNPKSAPAEVPVYSGQVPAEAVLGTPDLPDSDSRPVALKFAQRLEALWSDKGLDLNQARDAFSLPASWLAGVYPEHDPLSEQDAVAMFAKNHQLEAVVVQNQARGALVDDHFLIIGQEIDGFRLVAVDEDSATFEAGGKQVVLRLASDR